MRPIVFLPPFQKSATGSVVVQIGETIVNCSVSVENKVPDFLDPQKQGWLTSEYSMLPASSRSRIPREAAKGKLSGRTMEIQRLIGRTLRTMVDLKKIPGKTFWIDCDVLQADGGTRCASITGASIALHCAVNKLLSKGDLSASPLKGYIAAISVGIVQGEPLLDLCAVEDNKADVDMNLVMASHGHLVEIQSSSEGSTFSDSDFQRLMELGKMGIRQIVDVQKKYLDTHP
jgi:ribonuclease PH